MSTPATNPRPTTASSSSSSSSSSASSPAQPTLPDQYILMAAAKIALDQDKPIMFDYYNETRNGTAFLGEDSETKEKMLVKNPEEYTSPVQHMSRPKESKDIIIQTENSIYIVHGSIKKKSISPGTF